MKMPPLMSKAAVFEMANSPKSFDNIEQVIRYADAEGYRHIIFNGMHFAKVHRNLDDAFAGYDTTPPDTWVKTNLYLDYSVKGERS